MDYSMSNFSDFIGGGGGVSFPTIFLHTSQTWVPPQDGNIMIHVIGAGGSGSVSTGSQISSGAAGGYCRKNSLAVTTSGSFTVVIGAGGASRIGTTGPGTAGGTTSVAGTGLSSTLTATGGAGGVYGSTAYTTGGVGSNGDFNSNGGRGGYSKGGGAIGLSGTGNDGGLNYNLNNTFGGDCDILGDFYSSSLGQLSGSQGGKGMYCTNAQEGFSGDASAEPLAGAGSTVQYIILSSIVGNASIGGGGGFSQNDNVSATRSGRGGEGCVVIQYIP
jgi:hypothetical protein